MRLIRPWEFSFFLFFKVGTASAFWQFLRGSNVRTIQSVLSGVLMDDSFLPRIESPPSKVARRWWHDTSPPPGFSITLVTRKRPPGMTKVPSPFDPFYLPSFRPFAVPIVRWKYASTLRLHTPTTPFPRAPSPVSLSFPFFFFFPPTFEIFVALSN